MGLNQLERGYKKEDLLLRLRPTHVLRPKSSSWESSKG